MPIPKVPRKPKRKTKKKSLKMHQRTASLENQDLPVKEKKKPYLTEPFLSCVPQAFHTKLLEAVRKEGPKTNVGPHQRRLHSDWKY